MASAKTATLSFRIEPGLKEAFRATAKPERRSIANMFEFIYVNGSHTLADPHNKVHPSKEAFQRLMFDVGNFESLE